MDSHPTPATIARNTPAILGRLRSSVLGHSDLGLGRRLKRARISSDVTALLTMIVLIALVTWDRLSHPAHLAQTDLLSYFMPAYSFLGERLGVGDIPAWNPHQFSGTPFAGNPESGWMYLPAMLAFTLLPPLTAQHAFVVSHIGLSAVATYALCRVLGFHPIGALTAGVAYAAGPVLVHTGCCTVFAEVEAWFPVMVLGAELAVRDGMRTRASGWLLAALGMSQVLAAWLGQGAYYGALLLGSYLVVRTLIVPPPPMLGVASRLGALALHGSVIFGLGFGLAAAGLFPRLDAVGRSTLAGGDYTGTGTVTSPDVGYEPLDLAARLLAESGGGRYYFGGAILLLAAVAPLVARRRAFAWYFTALTAIPIVLTMDPDPEHLSDPTPLHTLFYLLPRFELLQSHVSNRILVVAFFGAAVAVGATVDAIGRLQWQLGLLVPPLVGAAWVLVLPTLRDENLAYSDATGVATALTVVIMLAATLIALPWLRVSPGLVANTGRVLAVLLLIVVFWDPAGRWWGGGAGSPKLWAAGMPERHAAKTEEVGGAAAFLATQQSGQPFRFFGFDPVLQDEERLGCCDYHQEVLQPEGESLLIGNRSMILGLHDLQGYDPVQDSHYDAYIRALNGQRQDYHEAGIMPDGLASPLLDMLNARYAVVLTTPPAADQPELTRLIDEWPTVYADEEVRVLENPEALPRAWIVHEARQVSHERALSLLAEGRIDPRTTALLENDGPLLEAASNLAADRATVTAYAPDEMRVTAHTDAPGLLVLSEVYDPGWRAYVDGNEVDLYRTNYLLRGVPIPAGTHEVELRYEPAALRAGLAVSSVSAIGAVGLALVAVRAGPSLAASWQASRHHGRRVLGGVNRRLRTRRVGRQWHLVAASRGRALSRRRRPPGPDPRQ